MAQNGPRAGQRAVVAVAFWIGLTPGAALADSFIDSTAYATSEEFGDDPGSDTDEDQTSIPGDAAEATTFFCPGLPVCVAPPGDTPASARGWANTRIQVNRASARASNAIGEDEANYVVDLARASSHWYDAWEMAVLPGAVGQAVSIEFTLEGAWGSWGTARFGAVITDSTRPTPEPNPDDPEDVTIAPGGPVAVLGFDSTSTMIFLLDVNTQVPFLPFEDGGKENGQIDETFVLSFIPVAGRTYYVGGRLVVSAGDGSDSFADFDGTARLTRVLVPEGVSFTPASGEPYEVVVVPEPATALLLALGAVALGFAGRRRSH